MNSTSGTPRILLVSGTVPGDEGVGGIVLRDLCDALKTGTIQCFAVIPRGEAAFKMAEACPEVIDKAERRYETSWRPVGGYVGEIVSSLAARMLHGGLVRRLIDRTVACGRRVQPDVVWAILDCPTTIAIAEHVAERLGLPLFTLVWDAPELLADQWHLDRFTRRRLLAQFGRVLRRSKQVAVCGESMQAAYDRQFSCQSIVVRHGISDDLWRPVSSAISSRREWIIGYAGSITAPDAFEQLIKTLDAYQWQIAGRDVVLRLMGARYLLNTSQPQRIEYFGRQRSVDDAINLLADCDILYLPQPFSEPLRPLAELSFPTKLSTYVAAGRPILLHAPAYASVVPFFDRYPFGEWCSSLNGDDLGDRLTRLATDHAVRETACAAISAARQEELNADQFVRSFREFLDPVAVRRPDVASTSLI